MLMTDQVLKYATEVICEEEGFSPVPYVDTEGFPTIGYGIRIGGRNQPIEDFDHIPYLPTTAAMPWTSTFIRATYEDMMSDEVITQALIECNYDRRAILISMAYQLGVSGLRNFRKTLDHITNSDFELAAEEMLDSRWNRQTPNRARRHAKVMTTGSIYSVY